MYSITTSCTYVQVDTSQEDCIMQRVEICRLPSGPSLSASTKHGISLVCQYSVLAVRLALLLAVPPCWFRAFRSLTGTRVPKYKCQGCLNRPTVFHVWTVYNCTAWIFTILPIHVLPWNRCADNFVQPPNDCARNGSSSISHPCKERSINRPDQQPSSLFANSSSWQCSPQ